MAGDGGGTFTSAARGAQFVAAAIDTIAEVGYARATLGRIAERVGVSKGVICYHFAGKDELVQEVIADIAARGGAFVYARALTLPTAAERLRGWIATILEYTAAHPTRAGPFHEIAAGSRGDAAVSAAMKELTAGVAPAVRGLFADGQASGEFRGDFDPESAATALLAIIDAVPPRVTRDPGFAVAPYGRGGGG